jgi:Family of unknown function (DUF6505)
VKLLRTIRLDPSDTFIFERAAEPGEWAVSGAFVFWNRDASKFEAKSRVAFRGGFLGVISLGWSTLVQIVDAKPSDGQTVVEALANQLIRCFGAPDMKAAQAAAEEEVSFAQSLCDHPSGTLIAIHRTYDDGEIRESFRTLRPRDPLKPRRVFSFVEVVGENEGPDDEIDLVGLAKEKPE